MSKTQVLAVAEENREFDSSMMKQLSTQIQRGLKVSRLRCGRITLKDDYILIDSPDELEVAETVAGYPGIKYAAVVESTSSLFDDVVNLVSQIGQKTVYPEETFKVSASQSGRFDYTPRDVEMAASSKLIGELAPIGARLDELNPSKTIYVKIDKETSYVFHYRYDGPGGLPVGYRGRAVCLLTGDKRSSVASWLAVRGGLMPHFLICDLQPYTPYSQLQDALLAVLDLRELTPVEGLELSVVRPSDKLGDLTNSCPAKMLPVILKRMLIKTAGLYAEKVDFDMVITGENFSKDPFWLLKSLTDEVTSLGRHLILPTLALTDHEIDEYAQNVKMTGKDEYPMLVVAPALREPTLSSVKDAEANLKVDQLIDEALKNVYRRRLDAENLDLHSLLDDMP